MKSPVYAIGWASLLAQLVKNPPAMWETWFDPWVGKIPWRRERLPAPVFWPGEFLGLYSLWGHEESDTTERLSLFPHAIGPGNLPIYCWKNDSHGGRIFQTFKITTVMNTPVRFLYLLFQTDLE